MCIIKKTLFRLIEHNLYNNFFFSFQYKDFDEIFNERGKLIRTINEHPQSEETCFMLKEYDHETCLQIQYELQSIMTQCYCLYDVIIKNFDKIIKSKQSYKRTDNNNINDNDNYNDDYRSALYS